MVLFEIVLLVDSEIVLSTRYGKTRVFINKTLSTETTYQQDLMHRDLLSTRFDTWKLGQGMRCCKCNSTSNVLVCGKCIIRCMTHDASVSEYVVCVSVWCVCVSSLLISSVKMT